MGPLGGKHSFFLPMPLISDKRSPLSNANFGIGGPCGNISPCSSRECEVRSEFLIISAVVLTGFILLAVWIFRMVARGKIAMSPGAALVALLVAILVVPFAMNLSAHFLSGKLHQSGEVEPGAEAREAR